MTKEFFDRDSHYTFCFIKAEDHKFNNPITMKRSDSSNSLNNKATKKPRTLSDVAASDKSTDSDSSGAAEGAAAAASMPRINRPEPFDVICGRGRPYQEHHGNKRLHEIAAVHKPQYLVSKRRFKKGIAEMIVKSIKNDETQPGRFLKRVDDEDDEVWEDVSDEVAREKVSHVLRFKSKSYENPSEASSSESGAGGASGIPGRARNNNQSSMLGLQSNLLATGQHHTAQESIWNSMTMSAFRLPGDASNYASHHPATTLPPSVSTLNAQRALLLNRQQERGPPIGGFDDSMLSSIRATGAGTASILSGISSSGTALGATTSTETSAAGALRNVSETTPVNLLSDEQVFLLEALIQRRRQVGSNSISGSIAPPAARFP
jgi:hypothetical protein